MKSTKTFFLSLATVALVQTASAQTIIRIAGSNGDRVATTQAIQNILTGTVTYAGIASSPNASNFSIFTGGKFNNVSVTVKTAFIGATGGIKAVAGKQAIRFLPNGANGSANPNPLTATNSSQYELAVPDFGVSTNFQTTSPFLGSYQGVNYIELTEIKTGVVGLRFVASTGFPADNLTTSQAQSLYGNGRLPLSFFTGLASDHNKQVFALGRNSDAGQRYGALAEFGLGINAVVKQYQPVISSGQVTSQALWPVEVVSGVSSQDAGNSGFSSGALLAAALPVTLQPNAYKVGNSAATAGYYIGYLTPSDANTILPPNSTAVGLKWNGVAYSEANVREGLYTAWLYTRTIYDPELENYNPFVFSFANGIAAEVRATTITSVGGGINLDTLVVERNSESAAVSPNENFF